MELWWWSANVDFDGVAVVVAERWLYRIPKSELFLLLILPSSNTNDAVVEAVVMADRNDRLTSSLIGIMVSAVAKLSRELHVGRIVISNVTNSALIGQELA